MTSYAALEPQRQQHSATMLPDEVAWVDAPCETRFSAFRSTATGERYSVGDYVLAPAPACGSPQPARLVALRELPGTPPARFATLERVYRACDLGMGLPQCYAVSAPGDTIEVPASQITAHCRVIAASAALSAQPGEGVFVLTGLCYHAFSGSFWKSSGSATPIAPKRSSSAAVPEPSIDTAEPVAKRARQSAPSFSQAQPQQQSQQPQQQQSPQRQPQQQMQAHSPHAKVSLPPLSLAIAVDGVDSPSSSPIPQSYQHRSQSPAPRLLPTVAQSPPGVVPASPPNGAPAYEVLPAPPQLQFQQQQQARQQQAHMMLARQIQVQQLNQQRTSTPSNIGMLSGPAPAMSASMMMDSGASAVVCPPKPVRVPPPIPPGARSKGRPVKYKFNPSLLGGIGDLSSFMEPPHSSSV